MFVKNQRWKGDFWKCSEKLGKLGVKSTKRGSSTRSNRFMETCILIESAKSLGNWLNIPGSNSLTDGFRISENELALVLDVLLKWVNKSPNFRPKIINWFQFNRRNSQPLPHQIPQQGSGRYRLCDIGNMDQTPIAYEFLDSHCYDFKSAKTVWIKTHRSGWDKRQATLMIYVSADGSLDANLCWYSKEMTGSKTAVSRKKSVNTILG